ncbi:MAG TPA: flagellar type III secretion system protein FliR [Sulfurimonas sp.]|nr:flagellar type III secretion system protein FliR [Sulfurimonas sp.]
MEVVEFLTPSNVVGFILLFTRLGGLFIMVPVFSHMSIPMTIKSSIAFVFTVLFFAVMPPLQMHITTMNIVLAIISEFFLGFTVGLMLQLVMNIMTFAGGQMSFIMGFSMASVVDPQSGISMPIIANVLALLSLMIFLSLNGHHAVLLFVNDSLQEVPLGGFMLNENIFQYLMTATMHMFMVGFMVAFPITALSLLADVIFGMLMKTMPQFNLLVIGFPIKIMVSFVVIIATLATFMKIFAKEMQAGLNALSIVF